MSYLTFVSLFPLCLEASDIDIEVTHGDATVEEMGWSGREGKGCGMGIEERKSPRLTTDEQRT